MVAKALDDTGHSGGWNHEIHWHRLSLTFTTALTFGKFNAASSSPTAVQLPRADSAFRAAPGSQATALKVSGAPRRRGRGSCCDAATVWTTPLANPVTYTCNRCDERVRLGADDARKHLYAGPALAARSADAAEVAFLVRARRIGRRGSVYDFSTFAFPYGPVDIDTALAHSFAREHAALAYLLVHSGFTVDRVHATRGSDLERSIRADAAQWLAQQ